MTKQSYMKNIIIIIITIIRLNVQVSNTIQLKDDPGLTNITTDASIAVYKPISHALVTHIGSYRCGSRGNVSRRNRFRAKTLRRRM